MNKTRILIITLFACILLTGCSKQQQSGVATNDPAPQIAFAVSSLPEPEELIFKPVMAGLGNNSSTVTTKPEEITAKGTTVQSKNDNCSTEFIDDYTRKYYYNTLTESQKKYYRFCFNQKRYLVTAAKPKVSESDQKIARFAMNRDNPHLLLYPTQYTIDNGFTSMTKEKRDKILKIAKDIAANKDPNNKNHKIPEISPIVTSCGNFFTTADGKDLIFEINSVLCYAAIKKISVITQ